VATLPEDIGCSPCLFDSRLGHVHNSTSTQGMQQHIVVGATLVTMELIEQAMAWV